jgi:hypothetical protein
MDPITAIGFASSIITFVDFGYQLVTGTLEVLDQGSSSEHSAIATVTEDLSRVAKDIRVENAPVGRAEHVLALRELAVKCEDLSKELLALLKSLRVEDGSSAPRLDALKVALRGMRKKAKVTELERRLDMYRQQVITRLLLMLK